MITSKAAKDLLECIQQGIDQTGDWRVALEQAADTAGEVATSLEAAENEVAPREELREMVKTALNSGSGDTEWATLVDIGGILGLEYVEEEGKYK